MDSPGDIMRLCRLCLVKDQVNVPIFEDKGDIKKIFLKISSCLPVKVSRDDKLPKKICDGCSNKLDMLYEFWTTAANAEKTLLSWLGQAGVKDNDADETMSAVAQQIQKPAEPYVKQETLDPEAATNASEVGDHFLLQNFMQKFSYNESASTGPSATVTSNAETDEPPPKRARRTAAVKAQINISAESEEDDDNDAMEAMTKVEDESDESDGEDREPTYVDVPGTSGADDDQPGPSGVGKDGVEAPQHELTVVYDDDIPIVAEEDLYETVDSGRILCKICGETSRDHSHYQNHLLTHLQQQYECKICGKLFPTPATLNRHVTQHKPRFKCSYCTRGFPELRLKKRHEKYDHRTFQKQYANAIKILRCDECSKGFHTQPELQRHKDKEHEDDFFDCGVCMRPFRSLKACKEHIVSHDPNYIRPEYYCDQCPAVLHSENSLRGHKQTHSVGRMNVICEVCGKMLSKDSMTVHMRRHTGEKPFVCNVCDETFIRSSTLQEHMRIHTNDRPYSCEFCGECFIRKNSLNMHVRRHHADELRYQCTGCSEKFFTEAQFNRHSCPLVGGEVVEEEEGVDGELSKVDTENN